MKKIIGNIIIKFILKADRSLKSKLFNSGKSDSSSIRYASFRDNYNIEDSFRFNGLHIQFYGEGEIICGINSYIGDYSTIQASQNYKVIIGNNCSISHNVRIYTCSNIADQDMNLTEEKIKLCGNVKIGNGVWIGANVFINPNIAIGDNVVIGANSVVTKNLEANGIYGGVPARLIRLKN